MERGIKRKLSLRSREDQTEDEAFSPDDKNIAAETSVISGTRSNSAQMIEEKTLKSIACLNEYRQNKDKKNIEAPSPCKIGKLLLNMEKVVSSPGKLIYTPSMHKHSLESEVSTSCNNMQGERGQNACQVPPAGTAGNTSPSKKLAAKINSLTIAHKSTDGKGLIKPGSSATINRSWTSNGSIKPQRAKSHILQESISFIDALCSAPVILPKKKKKVAPKQALCAPTTPGLKPPKLEYCRNNLELRAGVSAGKIDAKGETTAVNKKQSSPLKKETSCISKNEGKSGVMLEGLDSVVMDEESNKQAREKSNDCSEQEEKVATKVPEQLISILAHAKRRCRQKSVQWVKDEDLKQVCYFELDEAERVNVQKSRPVGELKSIEAKWEREVFKKKGRCKRKMRDRMREEINWWTTPILIDATNRINPLCMSQEKEIQRVRENSTLPAIYLPWQINHVSPQEPDADDIIPHGPKIIPLKERDGPNNIANNPDIWHPKSNISFTRATSSTKITSSMHSSEPHVSDQLPSEPGLFTTSLSSPPLQGSVPQASSNVSQVSSMSYSVGHGIPSSHPPSTSCNISQNCSTSSQPSLVSHGEPVVQSFYCGFSQNVSSVLSEPSTEMEVDNTPVPNSLDFGGGNMWSSGYYFQSFQVNQNPGMQRFSTVVPYMYAGVPPSGPFMGWGMYQMNGPCPGYQQPPPVLPAGGSTCQNSSVSFSMGYTQTTRFRTPLLSSSGNIPRASPVSSSVAYVHRSKLRTVLCRNFKKGECKYGTRCTFLHPGVNGPDTSTNGLNSSIEVQKSGIDAMKPSADGLKSPTEGRKPNIDAINTSTGGSNLKF